MPGNGTSGESPSEAMRLLRGVGGIAIGGFLLWLALRNTSAGEIAALARQVRFEWVAFAVGLYAADLALRTYRWRALLNGLYRGPSRHSQSYRRTGEVLLVGYGVNNLLPARLGELFRADYGGRRLALNPTTVFGTIVIERLLDGVMVATALCGGLLMLLATGGDLAAGYREPLAMIAGGGGAMISAAVAAVWAAIRYPRLLDRLPRFGRQLSGNLVQGLGCIRQADMGRIVAMTLLIWLLEGAAIWSLVYSAGIALGWWESVVLVGALSLGTLLPTAPAYVGSYQLIFGLCLAAFGLPSAVGVLGASMVQVFLLGPVTIAGLLVYSALHVSAVVRVADG